MNKKLNELYKLALVIEKKIGAEGLSLEDKITFCQKLELIEENKISQLSARVKVGMNQQQFTCFIVPIERELKNRITDAEILIEQNDDILENKKSNNELIIVLDNIRSPFNMGAVLRSCDALGVKEVLTTGYTPGLDDLRVQKISMGAWKNIHLIKFKNFDEVRAYLMDKKYKIIAVETVSEAINIQEAYLEERSALVFGNERFGLSKQDLLLCDQIVKLPVFGIKNSLNINAALTVCGYEWIRQIDFKKMKV